MLAAAMVMIAFMILLSKDKSISFKSALKVATHLYFKFALLVANYSFLIHMRTIA